MYMVAYACMGLFVYFMSHILYVYACRSACVTVDLSVHLSGKNLALPLFKDDWVFEGLELLCVGDVKRRVKTKKVRSVLGCRVVIHKRWFGPLYNTVLSRWHWTETLCDFLLRLSSCLVALPISRCKHYPGRNSPSSESFGRVGHLISLHAVASLGKWVGSGTVEASKASNSSKLSFPPFTPCFPDALYSLSLISTHDP